jgi:hypothetical protein
MLLERLVARLARHDDERDVFERGVLLQLVADREAVHAGQLDRQEDQVGLVGSSLLEADVPVVDHRRAAAELPELVSKLARESGVAFEHEDFGRHGGGDLAVQGVRRR